MHGQLQLHQAINTLTPRNALALGLRVDSDALSPSTVNAIKHGNVNLDDPAVTRMLIQQNAVLGVVGFFNSNGMLSSVGLTCAICHSTVNDSVAPGIGSRIDGLANRDLNVGAIAAAAANLQPVVNLLNITDPGITVADVRNVLNSWGPGKCEVALELPKHTSQQSLSVTLPRVLNCPRKCTKPLRVRNTRVALRHRLPAQADSPAREATLLVFHQHQRSAEE